MESNEEKKEKKQMSFKKNLFGWLKPIKPNFAISANEAYLQARYNRVEDKETRYNRFINNTNRLITERCQSSKYYATVEIDMDLIDNFMDDAIEYYVGKGYSAVDMRSVIPNLDKGYIFISWATSKD